MAFRILHIAESGIPEAGTIATGWDGLFAALAAQGIESVSLADDVPPPQAAVPNGRGALASLVEASDVVHIHGWRYDLAYQGARAAGRAHKPYVISPYGSLCNGRPSTRTRRDRLRGVLHEKRLVRRAAAVTVVNEIEDHALAKHGSIGRIVTLPLGMDTRDRGADDPATSNREPLPPGRCLLMLGSVHPIEGFVPLLTALSELGPAADGWNVIMAGPQPGPWKNQVEAAVRRKGAAERVIFARAATASDQRALLSRASLLAVPSLLVRCPVSIMQALAAGVGVLASTCAAPAGTDDLIRVCGPTRQALRKALSELLAMTDEQREAHARKAREAARERFDWSVVVGEYVRLYRSVG